GQGGTCQSSGVRGIPGWLRSGSGTESPGPSGKAREGTSHLVLRNEDVQGDVRRGRWLRGRGRELCPSLDGRLRCFHPWPEHVRSCAWEVAGRSLEGLVGRQSALSRCD